MRIACIQHVPFEGPGNIENWAVEKGYSLSKSLVYQNQVFPKLESFDFLLIMGGPQSSYEEDIYPWLKVEKELIADAISTGKIVIGVCLGAQLIANVLGSPVYPAKEKEIGWFPVYTTEEALSSNRYNFLPREFTPLHWHGDTFDLPQGAIRLVKSEACINQAFIYKKNVLGLQFHLEFARKNLEVMLEHAGKDLIQGKFVQSADEMRSLDGYYSENLSLLKLFLDAVISN